MTTYDGQSIFPLAYVQAIGCFIMGLVLHLKEPINNFYPPLYTALTTGFCGSLTTFSGWQLDIFGSWINSAGFHRSGLRDLIDGIGKSAITLALSLASVSFGASVASYLHSHPPTVPRPTFPVRYTLFILAVLTYAATFPAYFLLPRSYRHQATAALLFAFPGALTRYILAVHLNTRVPSFPVGTFVANMFGTALLTAFHVLQSISSHPVSSNSCAILQGLSDGYCGCLTTVSTFAAEIISLKSGRKKLRYILISWTVAQLIILLIFGTSWWVGSVAKHQTCIF